MLKRLHLKNFTVFADANFEFSPGLNVLVGTNGTGKSHVLKLGYVAESARFNISKQFASEQLGLPFINSTAWTATLYKSLPDVFLSAQLAPLIRWNSSAEAEVEVEFSAEEKLSFKLIPAVTEDKEKTASISDVEGPSNIADVHRPSFIPAKEILTLSWMLPGSEQLVFPIEKNYLDLLSQLRLLPLRKPDAVQSIQVLTDILGGEVQEENDKYYLVSPAGRRTAISLVRRVCANSVYYKSY